MKLKSIIFVVLVVFCTSASTYVLAQTNSDLTNKELAENQRDANLLETTLRQDQAQKIDEQKRADEHSDAVYFAQKRNAERQKVGSINPSEATTKMPVKANRPARKAYNMWISDEKKPTAPVKMLE
ncbi:hypothetical protein [Spirosoma pomorum]